MQLYGFGEILESLAKLDSWLASLGIPPKTDRWHRAAETVRQAQAEVERTKSGEQRSVVPNYVSGLFEAMEAREILLAFCGQSSPRLKEKLQRALSGPVAPQDETSKNSAGRNTMFELSLAADWKNRGLSVGLGEPDILLDLSGSHFLVECKRPLSINGVWGNIEAAARQLGKELDKPSNGLARGIVAISLSRAITQNNMMCCAIAAEGKAVVKKTLHDAIAKRRREWGVARFKDFHPRIVAVMFHFAVPWDVQGEKLIHMSAMEFVPAAEDVAAWKLLKEELSDP